MSRLRDNVLMYWPLVLGLVLFVPAVCKYYAAGLWLEYAGSAALALYGFVATAFPEEVSSWTGRYSWTYESFWTYPATYLRFSGIVIQIGVLLLGF